MFPAGHQSQMRQQLSLALLAMITQQQLVPAADGSDRYPAIDIFDGYPCDSTSHPNGSGSPNSFGYSYRTRRRHGDDGTVSRNNSVFSGEVARETAFSHCYNAAELQHYLKESLSQGYEPFPAAPAQPRAYAPIQAPRALLILPRKRDPRSRPMCLSSAHGWRLAAPCVNRNRFGGTLVRATGLSGTASFCLGGLSINLYRPWIMNDVFRIRCSTPNDAEGMLRAHYSAVHETAKKDYSDVILNLWSRPVDAQRIAAYLAKMETDESVISFVAVDDSGQAWVSASRASRNVGGDLRRCAGWSAWSRKRTLPDSKRRPRSGNECSQDG